MDDITAVKLPTLRGKIVPHSLWPVVCDLADATSYAVGSERTFFIDHGASIGGEVGFDAEGSTLEVETCLLSGFSGEREAMLDAAETEALPTNHLEAELSGDVASTVGEWTALEAMGDFHLIGRR